ncbi:ParB/RepB/Spo0J family partition protein [Gordonibacter sp. RACS_AR68]|uniref:ParB/RepB/Spo0J family partition protein n=1 Tax=Gordonibacter sp. RACS_AR68 TaxID=2872005 RepID=UPI002629EBB2|nr:ParB/RepB/Spo0J family partition protein [Gordonibacter sp. RACS_AR68]MDN4468887.1 ParB/RepB/Spo0J family partition protein [Gordonibacter sp. RACS_AR68]
METTKIPLSSCIESKHQNRKDLGDVTGLARSIEVNGQITPLIVVADGEAYQLVAGHRRTAAMKSLGLEEADAYVMDGWDDARIAQILNAENNHRKELTEAERGRGIQTMLSLGVPVSDAAVSADVPEEKAESYVRGTKLVPADAVNLDFDVVALMGEYDDVLTEDDVVAIFSKKSHWDRVAVCQAARARAAAETAKAELEERGVKIVEDSDIREGDYHHCDGDCDHAGLVATVSPNRWSESASIHFYCDDEAHVHQPTPEEIAANEAYEKRTEAYETMQVRIIDFAKNALPKFPAKGQTKLRQWAYEAFEAAYECELDDAWEGFKEPRGKALDQFILMRTVPNCVPDLPWGALREGYEVTSYWLDELLGFISFIDDVLMPAGYELSEDERDLMEHLHGLFAGDDEDEVFGEDEATEAIEDAAEADDDECPFDADTIDGEYLDGHLVIAKAA